MKKTTFIFWLGFLISSQTVFAAEVCIDCIVIEGRLVEGYYQQDGVDIVDKNQQQYPLGMDKGEVFFITPITTTPPPPTFYEQHNKWEIVSECVNGHALTGVCLEHIKVK